VHRRDDNGNGYIWHTTGSGKTLTSFKASTLLKENDHIHKCVFVVDRKDLDRQTREEFNKFQEGCVEENTNTAALVRRLLSEDYADKVIVTTIQKLGLALDENSKRNKQRKKNGQPTYKEQLAPLRTNASSSSSTSATARSSARTTRPSKSSSPRPSSSASPARPSSRPTPPPEDRGRAGLHAHHGGPLPEAAPRLHHHPRHRGRERPALPHRLLQARGQKPAQARRGHRQESRHRGHPLQARCRHRRTPLQCHPRHRVHQ
jgi:hypothetical protein